MQLEIWSTLLSDAGGATFAQHMSGDHEGKNAPQSMVRPFAQWCMEQIGLSTSIHTLPALGLAILEPLTKISFLEKMKV